MKDIERVDTPSGIFYIDPSRDPKIYRALREHGGQQLDDVALLTSLVRPGDFVIDIGAHIGTVTIPLARTAGSDGHVLACEPNPPTASLLEKNIAVNGFTDTIELRQVALGATHGTTYLAEPSSNRGGSYISADHHAGTKVPLLPLDEILTDPQYENRCPALIKIDAEGYEYEVLRGAQKTLAHCAPILFFEINRPRLAKNGRIPSDLSDILQQSGYHFYKNLTDEDGRHVRLGQLFTLRQLRGFTDVLATTPDHPRLPREMQSPTRTLLQQIRSKLVR